jgi:hypothetical protein
MAIFVIDLSIFQSGSTDECCYSTFKNGMASHSKQYHTHHSRTSSDPTLMLADIKLYIHASTNATVESSGRLGASQN